MGNGVFSALRKSVGDDHGLSGGGLSFRHDGDDHVLTQRAGYGDGVIVVQIHARGHMRRAGDKELAIFDLIRRKNIYIAICRIAAGERSAVQPDAAAICIDVRLSPGAADRAAVHDEGRVIIHTDPAKPTYCTVHVGGDGASVHGKGGIVVHVHNVLQGPGADDGASVHRKGGAGFRCNEVGKPVVAAFEPASADGIRQREDSIDRQTAGVLDPCRGIQCRSVQCVPLQVQLNRDAGWNREDTVIRESRDILGEGDRTALIE